ncbi:MAG: 5-dehydro-4-deoxy-D-glucuronate isomerase [Spirochaetales bacterium]|nr:5-dehydro-4-deoxy-D-glucuronate isomerase [Spirochaetales bacterium]
MDIRHPVHPDHAKIMDTADLRRHFLITDLFQPGKLNLTYSHYDRIIVGGICPGKEELVLKGGKELGSEYFLEGREAGVINIGEAGWVKADGTRYDLGPRDAIYLGRGIKELSFGSVDPSKPAKLYLNSGPAHAAYPTKRITLQDAKKVHLGSREESNERTINQYIHPAVLEACQLSMGMTLLEPGCVWNTMPCHTHERRMEVYFYFDLPKDGVVFHYMGEPEETRHIVVRNEEVVLSPSWSLHSGVGTCGYTFIWGMVGENKTFTDMDNIPMSVLK